VDLKVKEEKRGEATLFSRKIGNQQWNKESTVIVKGVSK